ncbi:methylated-DNA--[protein]-cysteine S-methyltransferase [Sutcliffiella deserti]|uniref:methylated-DNA--[protein]-cysteine S-methyltransferase n=1 Tax=Sutcliffiella deserti TaxID=2875501 RepID=UPI001CBBAFE7|nr:methylated-DNA--[protein]-cysteine S-methyltransferase [Sutcliffiella deserti]
MFFYKKMESPISTLYIVCDENSLASILFCKQELMERFGDKVLTLAADHPMCLEVEKQLTEYFNGDRTEFSLPIQLNGTPFQVDVWNALSKIPYGSVRSYKEIAEEINKPLAVRAVGQANKRNSFPIVIPCHRVIGKNNTLVGYAGDKVGMKEKLLILEGVLH